MLAWVAATLAAGTALAACGGDDSPPQGTADPGGTGGAEVIREQNEARLGGLVYRVPLFRQLNPRIAPDAVFYEGPKAPRGVGIYAAFVRVCNASGRARAPTSDLFLEDAFGQRFRPVPQPDNELAYRPERIGAGECVPSENSSTTADGAVVAFRVPFDSIAQRPLSLVIEGREATARVELDV